VRGIVTDTADHPLNAIITVLNHDTLHSEIRTDSINGNYHRMLAPGFYSFRFTAEGYFPQTINNVAVNNFQTTILNVELIPNLIPVELISFTAEVVNNEVKLSWQTATETNNSGFEVHRKKSEVRSQETEWETIGFIPGDGTTTEINFYSFVDKNVTSGNYQYRLKQIDFDGSYTYSIFVEVEVAAPNVFSLEQNYPNPFNPSTIIKFTIPETDNPLLGGARGGLVTLKIYDILGNEIAILVNEEKPSGNYEAEFNSHSDEGQNLVSGVYFYQLRILGPEINSGQGIIQTKKMVLMK
jgi:hypothetical protein